MQPGLLKCTVWSTGIYSLQQCWQCVMACPLSIAMQMPVQDINRHHEGV